MPLCSLLAGFKIKWQNYFMSGPEKDNHGQIIKRISDYVFQFLYNKRVGQSIFTAIFFRHKKPGIATKIMANLVPIALYFGCVAISILLMGCGERTTSHSPTFDIPLEYADKHMPEGWWNDPKILSEGRLLYQGVTKSFVNCAKCHGRDGKPQKRGAPDFRDPRRVRRFSDSYWFWRIDEGVPMTTMEAWGKKISNLEIWKIVAYQRNFGLKGKIFNPAKDRWEDEGTSEGEVQSPE